MKLKKRIIRIDGLVSSLGFLASAGFLVGYFGKLSWLFDLFSHFRMQYLVLLTLVVCYFGICKRVVHIIVYGLFLFTILGSLFSLYVGKSQTAVSNCSTIMHVNVLTSNNQKELLKNEIEYQNPDIIVLEELDSLWGISLSWMNHIYPYTIIETREDNFWNWCME